MCKIKLPANQHKKNGWKKCLIYENVLLKRQFSFTENRKWRLWSIKNNEFVVYIYKKKKTLTPKRLLDSFYPKSGFKKIKNDT